MKIALLFFLNLCSLVLFSCKPVSSPKSGSVSGPMDPGEASLGESWTLRPATKSEVLRSVPSIQLASSPGALDPELIFASYEPSELKADEQSTYIFRPAIALKTSKSSPVEFVVLESLARYDWVGAASLRSKNYFWGLLDYRVEGSAHSLPLLWSPDAGRSWSLIARVPKIHYADAFRSFGMEENGRGHVSFVPYDVENGFYIVETSDFGKNWSKPRSYLDLSSSNILLKDGCAFGMNPVQKIASQCALPAHFLE